LTEIYGKINIYPTASFFSFPSSSFDVQLENTRLEQQGTKFFINWKQTFFGTKKKQSNVVRRGYGL